MDHDYLPLPSIQIHFMELTSTDLVCTEIQIMDDSFQFA